MTHFTALPLERGEYNSSLGLVHGNADTSNLKKDIVSYPHLLTVVF